MILNVLCMIMCKKIPEGVVNFRTDDLHKKIKLLPLPRGFGFESLPNLTKNISEKLQPGEKGPSLVETYRSGLFAETPRFNSGE